MSQRGIRWRWRTQDPRGRGPSARASSAARLRTWAVPSRPRAAQPSLPGLIPVCRESPPPPRRLLATAPEPTGPQGGGPSPAPWTVLREVGLKGSPLCWPGLRTAQSPLGAAAAASRPPRTPAQAEPPRPLPVPLPASPAPGRSSTAPSPGGCRLPTPAASKRRWVLFASLAPAWQASISPHSRPAPRPLRPGASAEGTGTDGAGQPPAAERSHAATAAFFVFETHTHSLAHAHARTPSPPPWRHASLLSGAAPAKKARQRAGGRESLPLLAASLPRSQRDSSRTREPSDWVPLAARHPPAAASGPGPSQRGASGGAPLPHWMAGAWPPAAASVAGSRATQGHRGRHVVVSGRPPVERGWWMPPAGRTGGHLHLPLAHGPPGLAASTGPARACVGRGWEKGGAWPQAPSVLTTLGEVGIPL